MKRHNGLYQGIVVSSNDPEGKRRITAQVPDVLGTTISEWARPATIIDAPLTPGDMVWIYFPNGDYRYPVYFVPNNPAHGRIIPTPASLALNGPGAAGITLDADVHAKKSDGGYVNVYAADFIETSSRTQKTDIRRVDFDSVEVVKCAPVYTFRFYSDENGYRQVGPLREDLPLVVHREEQQVSVGSLVGILWDAVGQLARRVEYLEQQLQIVKENPEFPTLEENAGTRNGKDGDMR